MVAGLASASFHSFPSVLNTNTPALSESTTISRLPSLSRSIGVAGWSGDAAFQRTRTSAYGSSRLTLTRIESPGRDVVAISMPVFTPEFDAEFGLVDGPKTEWLLSPVRNE